jgi:archaellum biogenesis ATPase FlaH
MDYDLAIDGAPDSVPGGTVVLLLHPSTGETDRMDTDFLKTDTDHFLVVSTRTTAREVTQKLEYYDVDEDSAEILDTLSVERGYSRRGASHIHYVSSPDDVDGILTAIDQFLTDNPGKRRVSLDSLTELAYYADEDRALDALKRLGGLLDRHDAVALVHVSEEVHDDGDVDAFRDASDVVVELDENGNVVADY